MGYGKIMLLDCNLLEFLDLLSLCAVLDFIFFIEVLLKWVGLSRDKF